MPVGVVHLDLERRLNKKNKLTTLLPDISKVSNHTVHIDHHIVAASIAVQPHCQRRKAQPGSRFHVQRICNDNEAATKFSIALQNKL